MVAIANVVVVVIVVVVIVVGVAFVTDLSSQIDSMFKLQQGGEGG